MNNGNLACFIGITLGGFIAIIFAALFFGGVLTSITTGILVALAISVAFILFFIISLSISNSSNVECFRNNGVCLLIGTIGTIIASIVALSVTLTPGEIIGSILIGLVAFFFTLTVTSIISIVVCLLNISSDEDSGNNNCSRTCRCNRT